VFIPFSMEIGQDWSGMQGEMARLIQDAKDDEEAASFTTGSGTPPAAQGVVTGATTTVTAAGTASFAIADVYTIEAALPPTVPGARAVGRQPRDLQPRPPVRHVRAARASGRVVARRRSTNAAGQHGLQPPRLPRQRGELGASALTTGTKIAVFGDFRYFLIVDRIGMDVELVPHLFGSNRRPTGQRGIFAIWRNNSKVLSAAAFRVLVTG
jgi:hypothetical protein